MSADPTTSVDPQQGKTATAFTNAEPSHLPSLNGTAQERHSALTNAVNEVEASQARVSLNSATNLSNTTNTLPQTGTPVPAAPITSPANQQGTTAAARG